MSTYNNAESFQIKVTGSGSVVFNGAGGSGGTAGSVTFADFTDGEDYDVIGIEGDGTLDEGTKTATGFDVSMTTPYTIFRIHPRKIGVVEQVT